MRRIRAALQALPFVLLVGCFAAPPAPAASYELSGCHPGSHGPRSALPCRRDADCVLCRDASERCGRLETRDHLALTNAACGRPPSTDACGGAQAACCGGRCVVSLGPPPL